MSYICPFTQKSINFEFKAESPPTQFQVSINELSSIVSKGHYFCIQDIKQLSDPVSCAGPAQIDDFTTRTSSRVTPVRRRNRVTGFPSPEPHKSSPSLPPFISDDSCGLKTFCRSQAPNPQTNDAFTAQIGQLALRTVLRLKGCLI